MTIHELAQRCVQAVKQAGGDTKEAEHQVKQLLTENLVMKPGPSTLVLNPQSDPNNEP